MGGFKFASEYHDRWNRERGDYFELLTRILMYRHAVNISRLFQHRIFQPERNLNSVKRGVAVSCHNS